MWQEPLGKRTEWEYSGDFLVTCARYQDRTEERYEYDGENQRCLETDRLGDTRRTERDRLVREYAYDRLGNPSRIETERGGALLADLRLFHDGNGNLTRKEGIVPGADGKPQKFLTAYTWDSRNRLASAGYGDYTEAFRYDGAGNRTARTVRKPGETEEEQFFYSPSNRLERRITHLGETAYQYDSQGNLVSEEGPAGRRIHQYDAWNREEETLTILYGRGGVPAVSRKQKNRYNAEGLRDGLETDGRMSDFFYQGLELAGEETRLETKAAGEKTRLLGRYVRGYGMAYADLADSEGSVSRHYFHLDQQGSTAFLTDGEGQVTCTYQYDAFGAEHGQSDCLDTGEWSPGDSGATGVNRIRYTGQQYDPATGQYYLRARFYNPLLGRFLQEDVYCGDGLNLYAYCGNNPIKYYDPSGYARKKDVKKTNPVEQFIRFMSKDEANDTLKEVGLVPKVDKFGREHNGAKWISATNGERNPGGLGKPGSHDVKVVITTNPGTKSQILDNPNNVVRYDSGNGNIEKSNKDKILVKDVEPNSYGIGREKLEEFNNQVLEVEAIDRKTGKTIGRAQKTENRKNSKENQNGKCSKNK